jgi:hypothetical protein
VGSTIGLSRSGGARFAIYSPVTKQSTNDTAQPALQRDPDEWRTGEEPMTDAQRSYLETLCRETGEEFDDTLSKTDASKRIDELRGALAATISGVKGNPPAIGGYMAKRKNAAKRQLINTGTDKRYVRRAASGRFNESDDVGRSMA